MASNPSLPEFGLGITLRKNAKVDLLSDCLVLDATGVPVGRLPITGFSMDGSPNSPTEARITLYRIEVAYE